MAIEADPPLPRRQVEDTMRRVMALADRDKFTVFESLRDYLGSVVLAGETKEDQQLRLRREALEAMKQIAAHLELKDGEGPTPSQFDTAAKEIGLNWTSAKVTRAYERWRNAKQALIGEWVPRSAAQRSLVRASAGSGIDLFRLTIGASDTQATAVPADAVLDPPKASTLPDQQPEDTQWAESWIDAQGLTGGDLDSAERLLVHYTGALDPLIRHLTDVEEGGSQGQVSFELPGWSLVLAPIPKDDRLEGGFAGAIEATPTDGHLDRGEVACLEIGSRKETQFDLAVKRSGVLAVAHLEVAGVQEDRRGTFSAAGCHANICS